MNESTIFDPTIHSQRFQFDYNSEETQKLQELAGDNTRAIDRSFIWRVALWKYNRVIDIKDDTLEKLEAVRNKSQLKIDSTLFKESVLALTETDGIGYPLASAILKFINPKVFPIIDVRAYRAVTGKKIYSSQYNFEVYQNYCKRIHRLAENMGVPLFEVDQQLYEFDKQHNGTIS